MASRDSKKAMALLAAIAGMSGLYDQMARLAIPEDLPEMTPEEKTKVSERAQAKLAKAVAKREKKAAKLRRLADSGAIKQSDK